MGWRKGRIKSGTGPGRAPLRTQARVILRSETVADVLARQFGTMLGQGTAP